MANLSREYLLTPKRYESIALKCDSFLRITNDNTFVVAISDLHIGRDTKKIFNLLKHSQAKKRFFQNALSVIQKVGYFFYISYRSIFFGNSKFLKSFDICETDLLIVSHYTGATGCHGRYVDTYFGEVARQLEKKGKSIVIAYINHTSENNSQSELPSGKRLASILLKKEVNFFQLIFIYLNLLKAAFCINNDSRLSIYQDLKNFVSINFFSSSTIRNIIITEQIGRIVKSIRPKLVVTTYEGHAWERMVFHKSRESFSGAKCAAYQHAPIFKYQHGIKRGLNKDYNPDFILTPGIVSKLQLEKFKELKDSNIVILGSGRYIHKKKVAVGNSEKKNCLVAPEGTIEECHLLFGLSLECALSNKNMSFIFRFPPMISIDILKEYDSKFNNLPTNICISKSILLDDILNSNFILYRGSSVVIQSVSLGLVPIYYKIKDELNRDPLFEISKGKNVVTCEIEFKEVLLSKVKTSKDNELIKYCNNIYSPLDVNILDKLL